jgi:hypothetical protein
VCGGQYIYLLPNESLAVEADVSSGSHSEKNCSPAKFVNSAWICSIPQRQPECRGLWHSRSPDARSLSCSPSPPSPSVTQSPSPPRSLVRDGQTSPHRPRLVVSRSTCPPLSPSPHANKFVIGTAEIKTHTTHHVSGLNPHAQHAHAHAHAHALVGVDLTQGFIQAELPKDGKAICISPPPGHGEEPD